MRVSIHQSQYIPWTPYFKKIAASDIFVLMDSVQYQKNGVQNRNQIRNQAGAFWLTIPVTGSLEDRIMDKRLADDRWRRKHWLSLQSSYAKAPYWDAYAEEFEGLYAGRYATLGAVNDAFFAVLARHAGLGQKVVRLSELGVPGAATELVLGVCLTLKATTYVSGTGAKDYLDEAAFRAAGVAIEYHESTPPSYPQFHGGPFSPALSILDFLFNAGDAAVREHLSAFQIRSARD